VASTEATLELTQAISAPPQQLFRACTEPRELANWQADTVKGVAALGRTLKLRWDALDASTELTVVDWDPPRCVIFRQGQSRVRFDLGHEGLHLSHTGLDPDDDLDGLQASWRVSLAQLAHYVERHPGRKRRVQWSLHAVRAPAQLVHLAFTQPELARAWLGPVRGLSEPTRPGAALHDQPRFELTLAADLTLEGRVLENSSQLDLALSCDNANEATLVMRTLPLTQAPETRLLALVWSDWGPPNPVGAQVLSRINERLGRLDSLLNNRALA
jgi:uncharacterized protein YndB with AHSA1/START domain